MIIGEFVNSDQPGWVKCTFSDAHGNTWTIFEKAPIVSEKWIDSTSTFPRQGFIACEILGRTPDDEIVSIDISKPWGVSAANGETRFDVFPEQIIYYARD